MAMVTKKPWTINGKPSTAKEVGRFCGLAESSIFIKARKRGVYEATELVRQNKNTRATAGSTDYKQLSGTTRGKLRPLGTWEKNQPDKPGWIPYDPKLGGK